MGIESHECKTQQNKDKGESSTKYSSEIQCRKMRKVEKRPDRRLSIHSPAVISEMDWNAQIAIQITKKRVVVRLRKPCSSQNHSPYWTACSTVRTETLQVQGGDQPPLPTNGNSFVACSMPKVLHAPANWKNIVRSSTSVQMFHTHTPTSGVFN